jgi:hypothetical protein
MPDEDPFATAEDTAPAPTGPLRRGRYHLPRLDGTHKPRGWMRVSNLVSAYSDQYALRVWEHLEVLKAVVARPDLLEAFTTAGLKALALEDFGVRKEAVEDWLATAKAVSGGDLGSNFGTQRHHAVEGLHAGLPSARHDAGTRRHLSLYESALTRHGLVALPGMQERIVHVPVLEVCGRIDNVLARPCTSVNHVTGEPCYECYGDGWTNPVIADLKTQRKFHTWLEIGAQFACYANAEAMWDEGLNRWVDMPHVSRDVALALWMPRETEDGQPRVDVYGVDIRAGWKTAQRAYEVVLDRAEAKSKRGNRAWLMPAPEVDEVERYAARYAAVDSLAEGRALSVEIRQRGLWNEILAQAAGKAFQRLTSVVQS